MFGFHSSLHAHIVVLDTHSQDTKSPDKWYQSLHFQLQPLISLQSSCASIQILTHIPLFIHSEFNSGFRTLSSHGKVLVLPVHVTLSSV